MQSWALQQVLKHMGHKPVMIDRCYDAPTLNARLAFYRSLSFIKHAVLKAIGRDPMAKLCNPFARVYHVYQPRYADSRFCRKHITKSPALYSDDELRRWIGRCNVDAFIVGSDQVWRQEYSPRIETYFLDFLPVTDKRKRIAYAASFGTYSGYIATGKLPICRNLLQRFDAVSVREDNGIKIARETFGRQNAIKALDPTLLLDVDDYRPLIKSETASAEPYVAAYILDENYDKTAILNEVTTHLKMPARQMSASYTGTAMPTVARWLATFAGAGFVVTDSFHGCVFSIIFGKPFIAIGNAERGLDRFTSLLGSLGLTDRLIDSSGDFNANRDTLLSPIDYSSIAPLLDAQRRHSLRFLTDALA